MMTRDIPPESISPSNSFSSRQAWSVKGKEGLENTKRNVAALRNETTSYSNQPTDPVIESLDEHEDVEEWLNEVINSRRAEREASTSTSTSSLQLRVDGEESESLYPGSSSSSSSLTTLESQLSSLSTTLSFSRQETLAIIDSTISNVNNTIPRLGLELRLMKDAALTLRASIEKLRQQSLHPSGELNGKSASDSSSEAASAALERLAALSTLHSRMASARDVLSLAESWSTLAADVASFLSESKYSPACSRLAEAKSSLAVFERTPEYESRKKLLEGLCNSLVNNISPSLVDAIRDKDVSESQRIAGFFSAIQKEEEFAEQWRNTRQEPWLLQWKNAKPREESAEGDEGAIQFAQVFLNSLDSLLTLLNEERLFAPSIFPHNPRKSVELFTSSALNSLDPPFTARLVQSMDYHDHEALLILVRIHTAVRDALVGITKIVGRIEGEGEGLSNKAPILANNGTNFQHSPGAMSPMNENKQLGIPSHSPVSPNATRQASHSRRLSNRRLSVNLTTPNPKSSTSSEIQDDSLLQPGSSHKQSVSASSLGLLPEPIDWERRLLEPLVEFQLKYAALEQRFLTVEAEKESKANEAAVGAAGPQHVDSALLGPQLAKLLREDFKMAKGLAEDATLRCISLTYGLSSDDLVSCIDQVYVAILERFRGRLEQRSREAVQFARRQANGASDSAVLNGHQTSSSVEEDQWKAFEESVGILSTMHQAEKDMEAVEKFIADKLKDVGEMILNVASPNVNDAMLRLCGQGTSQGFTKAPLAILVRQNVHQLQSSSLTNTLENARIVARESRSTSLLYKRQVLLNASKVSLSKQLKMFQHHLIDMTLAPLMSNMEVYTQLPIWEASRLPGSVNEYELTMPTFSLSPTEEMSRIGEGLLDLPRLLEVWSDNADLRWAVRGLPFVSSREAEEAAAKEEEQQAELEAVTTTASVSPTRSNKRMSFHPSSSPTLDRRANSHRHTASLAAIATVPTSTTSNAEDVSSLEDDSESVLQTYLSSIALSLLSHLTSLVLPSISKLTLAGASQMVADLEYLLNILSALNVNTSAAAAAAAANGSLNHSNSQSVYLIRTLEAWKDSCKLKDADGKRIVNSVRSGQLGRRASLSGIEGFNDDEERLRSLASTQAFDMVGKMRGW